MTSLRNQQFLAKRFHMGSVSEITLPLFVDLSFSSFNYLRPSHRHYRVHHDEITNRIFNHPIFGPNKSYETFPTESSHGKVSKLA